MAKIKILSKAVKKKTDTYTLFTYKVSDGNQELEVTSFDEVGEGMEVEGEIKKNTQYNTFEMKLKNTNGGKKLYSVDPFNKRAKALELGIEMYKVVGPTVEAAGKKTSAVIIEMSEALLLWLDKK